MKSFKVPKKYRNITIPYYYCDYKHDLIGYIYKDQFYSEDNLNELFLDYIGFYLNYHIEIDGQLKIVHSPEEVAEILLNNYNKFIIPEKYKDDFSEDEYKQFIKVQNYLKEKKRAEFNETTVKERKENFLKRIKNKLQDNRLFKLNEEMKSYNYKIPTRVYSKVYKKYFYVVDGNPYWTLLSAFEEIYNIGFYYQYNGDGIDEYSDHYHAHDFEYVIRDAMKLADKFIIYEFQEEFFSKQEREFLKALTKKLKDMSYLSVEDLYDGLYQGPLATKYYECRDKKQYIKAFIYDKKLQAIIKKQRKQDLENHKI